MSFIIDHPTSWIGIPERFPFPRAEGAALQNADEWVDELLDELADDAGLREDQRDAAREVLLMVANTRGERDATRSFIAFASWDGPVYVVDAIAEEAGVLGGMTLAQYAGEDDPDQLVQPDVTPFVTESGLDGVRCVRHQRYEEGTGIVMARVDYAWLSGEQLLRLTGAQLDLVLFERMLPLTDELAATVAAAG